MGLHRARVLAVSTVSGLAVAGVLDAVQPRLDAVTAAGQRRWPGT